MNGIAEATASVVVCRKNQLREAAVVLSCIPNAASVPLIVLEEPPASQARYRSQYAAYRVLADARDRAAGDGSAPAPGNVDALAEQLTPYRQWAKHQRFVAKLLARLAPSSAIFLFEPGSEDDRYLDPLARHRLSDTQYPIVPGSAKRSYFLPQVPTSLGVTGASTSHTYATLSELSDLAWAALRGNGARCAAPVEVAESQTADYFTGLYRAIELGVALRPLTTSTTAQSARAAAPGALLGGGYCDPAERTATEAVLIESTLDAERLIGVQYAYRHAARLLVIDEPDGAPIETARAAVERRCASALPAGLTPEQIVAAVRASLFSDDTSTLTALETAVSAAIPQAAVEAVGTLPLTALTTSTPYHFVRNGDVSWAEKPIGHVAGDISLLLLTAMYPAPDEAGVGFNLLFDPGYIGTTETSDVLSDLNAGSTYSLLLAGRAGASLALTHLAPMLPIELLFLNTHGSDNGIKLADMPIPLPAYKIVQRTTFDGRPIVFNNSCLSWVGVGREFVRAGARGYIGTLWSVHDAQAAAYAKSVIARMVRSGDTVSAAMRESGVSAVDARAYVFVGTATERLRQPQQGSLSDEGRLLRAASFMLNAADALVAEAAGSLGVSYLSAIADVLVTRAEAGLQTIDAEMSIPSDERVDDALMQMRIYAAFVERDENATRANQFFVNWISALKAVPDATLRGTATAQLLLYASRIPARVGPWRQAVAALEASITASLGAKVAPIRQYLELCDAYLSGGQYARAKDQVELAMRCYAEQKAAADYELLVRQSRVALCYGASSEALRLAGLAFAAANASDDLRKRASAKIDEANAFLALGEKEHALASAQAADGFARLSLDSELQLHASEVLARALLANERLDDARDLSKRSLDRAKAYGWTLVIAAQAEVSGDIAARSGESVPAIVAWCGAASMYVKVARPVLEARLLQKVRDAALALGTSNVTIQYLRLCLATVDDFEAPLRAAVAQAYVKDLASLVTRFGVPALRSDLDYLRSEMNGIVAARGADASEDLRFMASMSATLTAESAAPAPHV